MRHNFVAFVALALLLPSARAAEAQIFGGDVRAPRSAEGWAPAWAGVRAGWDYNARGTVVGAQLRIPLLPSGYGEIVPNAEVTLRNGAREYQGGADAVFVTGGRWGGVYAGVGVAWRNMVWDAHSPRETRSTPVTVAGVRTGAVMGAPFGTQIEMRWTWLDRLLKPKVLTLGINFPLWGASRGGR